MTVEYAKNQPSGFTNRIQRVAIVGAGGSVGRHFAKQLLDTGKHTVTALTRIDSQTELPQGIRSIQVDYADEGSLAAALQGQDILILTLAVMAPLEIQSKLIQAAATAGVRYVMPNAWSCDLMNDDLVSSVANWGDLRAAFDEVEKTGVCSWIALFCGFWYEHSLLLGPEALGFDFASKRLTYFDDGNVKMNVSTHEQCGRAIAALLSLKLLPEDENDQDVTLSHWRNKPVYTSSFLLSQRDMFESWKRVTGDRDEDWTIDYQSSEERYQTGIEQMKTDYLPGFVQSMYSRVFFPSGDGDFEHKHGLANSHLALPDEGVDEHTRQAKAMLDRGWNYLTNRN